MKQSERAIQDHSPEFSTQAKAVLDILRSHLGETLLAVYLHGSAVSGGLKPQSDIDFLAVIDRAITTELSKGLLSSLLRVSGHHPARPDGPRCIEVIVILKTDLSPPGLSTRAEFIYGEWLRDAFEAGEIPTPVSDPEVTLVLAQARQEAQPLYGPAATELLPEIPADHMRCAMSNMLPVLIDNLIGDERNALLTLARMWHTAITGKFATKDAAAIWAIPQLPGYAAEILAYAREAYIGKIHDDWEGRETAAWRAGEYLHRQVAQVL